MHPVAPHRDHVHQKQGPTVLVHPVTAHRDHVHQNGEGRGGVTGGCPQS